MILFVLVLVLVLVNWYFIEDEHEYDDEKGPSDLCHLTSIFSKLCLLSKNTF
jgi:hypothetical protein